jgi:hypothetical protein
MKSPVPYNRICEPVHTGTEEPCVLCGKGVDVTVPHKRIHVVDGGANMVTPDHPEEDIDPSGDMLWLVVGSGCARKVKDFAVDWECKC